MFNGDNLPVIFSPGNEIMKIFRSPVVQEPFFRRLLVIFRPFEYFESMVNLSYRKFVSSV